MYTERYINVILMYELFKYHNNTLYYNKPCRFYSVGITVINHVFVDAPTTIVIHANLCVYFYWNAIYLWFQEKRLHWCLDFFLRENSSKMDKKWNIDIRYFKGVIFYFLVVFGKQIGKTAKTNRINLRK